MIELYTEHNTVQADDKPEMHHHDELRFSFPEIHPDARFSMDFQRTLRIPDDDTDHFLPPGLGNFPLRHVDDFAGRVPGSWRDQGGVMLPMFQSEALWIDFESENRYPFLVKVAAGKINAVTGRRWEDSPHRNPQDYLVIPDQPWLDGFCVEKGVIRQFVAAPLGEGYSVEEQVTGEGVFGGLQVVAYPMKAEEWEKIKKSSGGLGSLNYCVCDDSGRFDMGLAMGGRMRQKIEKDPHPYAVWDLEHGSRCFVHIANSLAWRAITGEAPPTLPPTAEHYSKRGLPWFEYYSDGPAIEGGEVLGKLKSVAAIDAENPQGANLLPENESTGVVRVIDLGPGRGRVRES